MKICEEMIKLREGLDKRGIKWIDKSDITTEERIKYFISQGISELFADSTMYRTHFEHKGKKYSVIFGYGSFGGINAIEPSQNNSLLEMMIDDDEPVGWLTADDVLKIIDKE